MGKENLLAIIASFTDAELEKIIVEGMERLIAKGDLAQANRLFAAVRQIGGHERLKAQAQALGALIATRGRDERLALCRYEELNSLFPEFDDARMSALFHLAAFLLPDKPETLFSLWAQAMKDAAPGHARNIRARFGELLERQFVENGDSAMAERVREIREGLRKEGDSR